MDTYNESNIRVLTGTEAVRLRVGMYFGDVDDGSALKEVVWEIVSNSIDQHLVGKVNKVEVSIDQGDILTVYDDGPGIDLKRRRPDQVTTTELVLTEMHTGPTAFGHSPHWHAGSHGLGLAPVNAVSDWLIVAWYTAEGHFEQRFERGRKVTERARIGDTERRGFEIRLHPDPEIFHRVEWDTFAIQRRLREAACLLPGLETRFSAHVTQRAQGDLSSLLRFESRRVTFQSPLFTAVRAADDNEVEVCLGVHEQPWGGVSAFCNLHQNTEGSHHQGFLRGARQVLRRLPGLEAPPTKEALRVATSRISGVVSAKCCSPRFLGPTRDRLNVPEVVKLAQEATREALEVLLEAHPEVAEALIVEVLKPRY